MPLQIGDPAPDATFGHRDGDVTLSSLWAERPVVVAFLRHFG
jgi:peroxiredoxin